MVGALCHGLPQLCLPQGTDQPLNAAALVRAGAGRSLEPDQVSASAVAAELALVLSDPGLRNEAERIASQIADMPSADRVAAELTA
jgi:UDP:flavonoid glycosyltransferase YjiC (YdhE family)